NADDPARVFERADLFERDRLQEQVPDYGRLDRAGHDREPRRRRRPPAERLVLGAAADEVHDARRNASGVTDEVDRLGMLEREAFERRSHKRGPRLRYGLAGRRTELGDLARYVWSAQCRVVRIEKRTQWLPVFRLAEQPFEGDCLALLLPGAAAFVQQPEPGHVAEPAHSSGPA